MTRKPAIVWVRCARVTTLMQVTRYVFSFVIGATLLGGAGACAREFGGSSIQIDFAESMPAQAAASAPVVGLDGPVPHHAHFRLYALQSEIGDGGEPSLNHAFLVHRFAIRAVVDLASPCFIDADVHARYQGIHVMRLADRIAADTGITDITQPPANAAQEDLIDLATAQARRQNAVALAGSVKAIVAPGATAYPQANVGCVADAGYDANLPPAASCMDDASNRARLQWCRGFWQQTPTHYEGNDLVLTAPLAGATFGFVFGRNPVNGAPIGGAQFLVPSVLDTATAFALTWQFDDENGDGVPDYPVTIAEAARIPTGQLVMHGGIRRVTRGVTNATLAAPTNPALRANLAIVSNLDEDALHF